MVGNNAYMGLAPGIAVRITILGLLLAGSANAQTLTVCPSECANSSVQAVVNAASSGDAIQVQSGTYYENVDVNKQLIQRGIGMPVVDANGSMITFSADGIRLEFSVIGDLYNLSNAGIKVTSNSNMLNGNNASLNNLNRISLYSSNNNVLSGNYGLNDIIGSWMGYLSNNTLRGNNASNNKIYHNSPINTNQAIDTTNANTWYSGDLLVGDYWSNYTGTDPKSGLNLNQPSSDGIGGAQYMISGGSSMNMYPLMIPFSAGIKGDLNNNGESADSVDLVLMKRASIGEILADPSHDLNNNGMFADVGDLILITLVLHKFSFINFG